METDGCEEEIAGEEPGRRSERKPISLRSNLIWMLTARVVYNGCQWGVLALLATLGAPETVGQFVLGISLTAPIFMFANLQLRLSQATDKPGEAAFADYRTLRLLTTGLALAAVAIAGWLADRNVETFLIVGAIGLSKAIESISDVYFGVLQRHEAIPLIARSLIIKGPTSLIALAIGFHYSGSVAVAAMMLTLSWTLLLFLHDIPVARRFLNEEPSDLSMVWRDRQRRILKIAQTALPLGVATGLLSLEVNVPRYIVEVQFGRAALGVFGALAYLVIVGQTVVQSLSYAIIPRLAKHYHSDELSEFRKILVLSTAAGGAVAAVFLVATWLLGPHFVEFFYGDIYSARPGLLIAITAAACVQFVNMVLASGLRAMRWFRIVFILQVASLATTAAACWIGGRLWSFNGVAYGMFVTAVFNLIALSLILAPTVFGRTCAAEDDDASTAPDHSLNPSSGVGNPAVAAASAT